MSNENAASTWNERYRNDPAGYRDAPRSFLVENIALLPHSGLALDVAMGAGNNSAALIEHGLSVIGLDISIVAAKLARHRLPNLQAAVVDLTTIRLPQATFDVIINFYYLQRDLWPQYQSALRPGGILILETLTEEIHTVRPDIRPEFLLQPGEIQTAFADWDILVYRKGWIEGEHRHHKAVESIIARRPSRR
jgi:2-polyprenyl-3-methyl-5-hydroxy-6-metoxy-1,4-benzoquinol methylase